MITHPADEEYKAECWSLKYTDDPVWVYMIPARLLRPGDRIWAFRYGYDDHLMGADRLRPADGGVTRRFTSNLFEMFFNEKMQPNPRGMKVIKRVWTTKGGRGPIVVIKYGWIRYFPFGSTWKLKPDERVAVALSRRDRGARRYHEGMLALRPA